MITSVEKLNALSELTIVIGTVTGREFLLDELLKSIRNQLGGEHVHICVSGNGTGPITKEISESCGVQFVQRPSRLPAEIHCIAMVESVSTKYTWIIGDDDILAPGALMTVVDSIASSNLDGRPLHAIIGRVRAFTLDDLSDLGQPNPGSSEWTSGNYCEMWDIANATRGVADLGAFIFQTSLFRLPNYNRYSGTSHELFGAFWDGLAERDQPRVRVLEHSVVFRRQGNRKEWDYSPLHTYVGLRRYALLLPESVSKRRLTASFHLSRRSALYLALTRESGEQLILNEYLSYLDSYDFLAVSISKIPYPLGKVLRKIVRRVRSLG